MKIVENPTRDSWSSLTKRPAKKATDLGSVVSEVFDEVQKNGDAALKAYTAKFDKVQLDSLKVRQAEMDASVGIISQELKDAMQLAKQNIKTFHASQFTSKK